jgi:hypothetical protein
MKRVLAAILVILFSLLFCGAAGDNILYVTKKDYPMAHTLEDLELFNNSLINNQTAIFLKLRQEGKAWMSGGGVEVYVVETVDGNKIKIRPTTSTTEIWTVSEAVQKK